MSGNSVALDTNQAIQVLNDVTATVAWLNTFTELCLPVTVLGELRFGAAKSARPESNLAKVQALVARCRILDSRSTTAELYAKVRLGLFKAGRPIPENDVWIAAVCIEHGLPLASDDAHFAAVEDLRVLQRP